MTLERVLVADDDDGLLYLMSAALKRLGYQVVSAENGSSALEYLQSQEPFAVLVTDLMMPDMTGIELIQHAHRRDPWIEVVVVTAAASIETAISALRAGGAYDYLLKPFSSMNELSMTVERAAAHRKLRLDHEALLKKIQTEAERLQALIANTGDAILSADTNGVLTLANPVAARLLKREDLIGVPALSLLPPPLATLVSAWQETPQRQPAVMELPWSDGSVQMVSLTPLNGLNGHRPGWVIVLRDITAIKRLDELKSQMLREAVGKIHLPMAQAMNALTELNSLAVQDERLVDVVYRLSSSWKQIQDWGDDLLDVARLNTDLNVNPNAVNLATVLNETQRSLSEGLIRQGKLKIKVAYDPDLPLVLADIAHLRRLLQMLINRAAARSKECGEIRLLASQHYHQVWIEISDDGPQISDANLNHIFDKSYGGAKGSALNSDIEVILVKTILERMGGQIWAGGQGSLGSTITICLPTFENPI